MEQINTYSNVSGNVNNTPKMELQTADTQLISCKEVINSMSGIIQDEKILKATQGLAGAFDEYCSCKGSFKSLMGKLQGKTEEEQKLIELENKTRASQFAIGAGIIGIIGGAICLGIHLGRKSGN